MEAFVLGFGLGFFVAAQLGPLSAAALLAGVGLGSLTWVSALAAAVAAARRWVSDTALRSLDALAGAGIAGFGGLLAYRTAVD